MSLIELKNVSYSYRSKYYTVHAVQQVNAVFERGKFYAIIGKSGSGKTTLLSLLAGLDLPKEGEIIFDGTPTKDADLERHRRENVAVIYQNFNLFPLLNSVENIVYAMELNGLKGNKAKEKAKELLKKVGLGEHCEKHYPNMLSGGEQQRVAIARALGTNATCILADEPTGNLDVANGQEIIRIFKQLAHEENYCVIVVTHDMSIAEEADVIYIMSDGKLNEK